MATIEEEEERIRQERRRPKTAWSSSSLSHPVAKGTRDSAGDGTTVERPSHEKAKSKLSSDGGSGMNEKGGSSREDWLTVTIDLDVLNCAFCSRELSPPIFQCYNGRLACSSCMHKAENNCPSSKSTAISCRNLAVEKIIDSIKVPCPYASRGCDQLISFLTVRVHKWMCEYSTCHCPAANCNFEAPTRELYHHFVQGHLGRSIPFQYNRPFSVFMSKDEHFRVLHAHEDEVLFLLLYIISETKLRKGNAVMVVCLGPDSMDRKYAYKVKARDDEEGSSVQLKSPMITIKGWEHLELLPEKYFLLIPEGFGGFGGLYLDLKITI